MSVVALALAIWLLGGVFGLTPARRWAALAVLWLVVMAVHLALPPAHGLRAMIGGLLATCLTASVIGILA